MVGGWVAYVVDAPIPTAPLNPVAFVAVGMAAVFAGTARVPLATLIMVAEMTGGYSLIVPSMLTTSLSFVVQQAVAARAKYPRLYEAQVQDRGDSPVHHLELVESAFRLLQEHRLADLSGVALPQLSDLVRFGRPIPIHGGKGSLLAVELNGQENPFVGATVAEALANRKEVVAVAILRGGSVMVPHVDLTLLEGDSLILAGSSEACTEVRDDVAGKGTLGAD